MKWLWCTVIVLALFSGTGCTGGDGLAVADVERILRDSVPGQAGEAHLEQARVILQKGMDDLRALFQGQENTPEAEAAIREGHAALERQFNADRLAVRQVLLATLEKVIKAWFAANAKSSKISAVAPAGNFFAFAPALDITDAILQEMNREKPVFHPLPTVTLKPQAQGAALDPSSKK